MNKNSKVLFYVLGVVVVAFTTVYSYFKLEEYYLEERVQAMINENPEPVALNNPATLGETSVERNSLVLYLRKNTEGKFFLYADFQKPSRLAAYELSLNFNEQIKSVECVEEFDCVYADAEGLSVNVAGVVPVTVDKVYEGETALIELDTVNKVDSLEVDLLSDSGIYEMGNTTNLLNY